MNVAITCSTNIIKMTGECYTSPMCNNISQSTDLITGVIRSSRTSSEWVAVEEKLNLLYITMYQPITFDEIWRSCRPSTKSKVLSSLWVHCWGNFLFKRAQNIGDNVGAFHHVVTWSHLKLFAVMRRATLEAYRYRFVL